MSNNTIHIDPYDPCYCGSDKKVKFCHPLRKKQEIPRPSPSDCRPPPGPPTELATAGCYARKLKDCSTEMSGEHLFSGSHTNPCGGSRWQGFQGWVSLARRRSSSDPHAFKLQSECALQEAQQRVVACRYRGRAIPQGDKGNSPNIC